MTIVARAFFIKGRTEPVNPGPGRHGYCTSIVLYDAPSQEAADRWAKAFVHHRLLDGQPEQKPAELKVLPFHNRLFTSTGDEQIDWPSFVDHASATDHYNDHPSEFHSSMMFTAPNSREQETFEENDLNDLDSFKKRILQADEFNWNPRKQFHYVLYHAKGAFMVRAMNMLLAARPYVTAVKGTPDGEYKVFISTWPGAKQYQT